MSPLGVSPAGDQATVSISVAVEPAVAFEVFTQETDLWWRRGLRYRLAGRRPGSLCFEPGVGGRLFESFDTSSGPHVHEATQTPVLRIPSDGPAAGSRGTEAGTSMGRRVPLCPRANQLKPLRQSER